MWSGTGRLLIAAGGVLVLSGLLLLLLDRFAGPGRFPGDIVVHKPGLTVFMPFGTMILLSLVLTIILNLIVRLRR
jgi:hypothetical protein